MPYYRLRLREFLFWIWYCCFNDVCILGGPIHPFRLDIIDFGLSPIITGLLMLVLYGENEFSKDKLFGLFFGLAGLALIFTTGFTLSQSAGLGIVAVLLSTVIYSFTAIKVKQHNQGIPALTITATGLMFAMPFYILRSL